MGDKALDSEPTGYYRFANLPPGAYTIEVSAKGFKAVKREGLTIEIVRLHTVDIILPVGTAAEVVEVSGQAPVIDGTDGRTADCFSERAANEIVARKSTLPVKA